MKVRLTGVGMLPFQVYPTAQAFVLETAATLVRTVDAMVPLGVGTTVQVLPFQRSARVRWPSSPAPVVPTDQMFVPLTTATELSAFSSPLPLAPGTCRQAAGQSDGATPIRAQRFTSSASRSRSGPPHDS